jgi:hypothetical protein
MYNESSSPVTFNGNSAINAGKDEVCPATDQRGVTRPQGTSCDLGAYEKGGEPIFIKTFLPSVKR